MILKHIFKTVLLAAIALVFVTSCGFRQVDEGSRGLRLHWGKVEGEPLAPGMAFYNPVTSAVIAIDVRERKGETATECYTNDNQRVNVGLALTYYPEADKIGQLYSQFGLDWEQKIIGQVVLGSLKDVVGRYKADDLVGKREQARHEVQEELTKGVSKNGIIIGRLDLTNLKFDSAYEQAVESKVVAIQKAAEAKNKSVEVLEKAKQTVESAKADAEAMRIKSNALSQNKGLVQYEAIQKWNGQLPQYMFGSTVPILNLGDLGK